jgi:hypothetical protein
MQEGRLAGNPPLQTSLHCLPDFQQVKRCERPFCLL